MFPIKIPIEENPDINRKARVVIPPIERVYREVSERIDDFEECAVCLTPEEAIEEASRCLHCPQPSPCIGACPLGNNISEALWLIEQGRFIEAAELYRLTNPMPEICGRVCPGEASCETSCVLTRRERPINTRALEAFVADYQRETTGVPLPEVAPSSGKRVAVIGAGPAGLAVAEDLAIAGHAVTVFEEKPAAGGMLVYGIPNFKLSKDLVQWKVDWLADLGIEFVFNTRIGRDITLDELMEREGFDAVFIGTGAQVEASLSIPGEDLGGVHRALDFLAGANLPDHLLPPGKQKRSRIGHRVAVIGGGDTATDCLRTAVRLGAEDVVCYYRRTEAEMPGNAAERGNAIEEGARIEYLTAPVELLDLDGDGNVDHMRMIRMELGEPDSSGRRRPVPVEGSEFEVEVDDVILAIGFWPDPLLGETTKGLETHRWGLLKVNPETGETSRPGVFAGGDNVSGPALVNLAIAAGKRAARAMNAYLQEA